MNNVRIVTKSGPTKVIRVERDLCRRLLSPANGGRNIDLLGLLKHPQTPVPLALATLVRQLRRIVSHLLADSYVVKGRQTNPLVLLLMAWLLFKPLEKRMMLKHLET